MVNYRPTVRAERSPFSGSRVEARDSGFRDGRMPYPSTGDRASTVAAQGERGFGRRKRLYENSLSGQDTPAV